MRTGNGGLLDGDFYRHGLHEGCFFSRELRPALGNLDKGRTVAVIGSKPCLGDVVEESEELVEILLLNRIVFVIMASRAGQRQPEKHRPHGLHPVGHVLNNPFVRNGAALGVDAMVAVKARGHLGIEVTVRQKVSRHLLDHKLVKRHI